MKVSYPLKRYLATDVRMIKNIPLSRDLSNGNPMLLSNTLLKFEWSWPVKVVLEIQLVVLERKISGEKWAGAPEHESNGGIRSFCPSGRRAGMPFLPNGNFEKVRSGNI